MKKNFLKLFVLAGTIAVFTSCTSINKSMREPNTRVNLTKADFSLSDQVTGEATSTRILTIDWERLFMKKTGTVDNGVMSVSLASIPVIGGVVTDRTANYALHNMMTANPGYDVVFYPQYETKVSRPALGIGFIYRVTNVKATARLAKLNK